MQTLVRYEYMAGRFAWPIPFPFTLESDVGVNLCDSLGRERALALGKDYIIQNGNVICVLPAGHSLIVYLSAPPAAAAERQAGSVQTAAMPAVMPASAEQPADASALERKLDLLLAALTAQAAQPAALAADSADGRVDELEARVNALLAEQETRKESARQAESDAQVAAISEAGAQVQKTLDQKTDVALDAITLATGEAERQLDQKSATAIAAASLAETAANSANEAAAAAAGETDAAIARLEARVAELEAGVARQTEQARTTAATAAAQAATAIAKASAQAQAEAAAASRLAGQAWPETGWQVLAEDIPAKSVVALPDPLRYWPGRNCIAVARNGFMLALGHGFEEVGAASALSNTVRLLEKADSGDLLSYWIMPTNVAQEAKESARAAETAACNARASEQKAGLALDSVNEAAGRSVTANAEHVKTLDAHAAQAQANIRQGRENALADIADKAGKVRADCVAVWQTSSAELKKLAQTGNENLNVTWRKAEKAVGAARADAQAKAEASDASARRAATRSGMSAAQAHELAACAWRAAFQASLDRAQPGVATVPSYADLAFHASGFYIINPKIRGPLPFMGVFPVGGIAETAGHDGVFLVGAMPYPEAPSLPDIPYPDEPSEVPEMKPLADVNHWLPCGHNHTEI